MKRFSCILSLFFLGLSFSPALAQEPDLQFPFGQGAASPYDPALKFRIGPQGMEPGVNYTEEEIRSGLQEYRPPVEPRFPEVKYLKLDPPGSLRERVDRLIEGIKVDIRPEYDHYGYELRRYMAHVGASDVFGGRERLAAELTNVKNAEIIFTYWRNEKVKEIKAIEKEIEAKNADSSTRTTFKFNQGLVQAFMTECGHWIKKNKEMLEFLEESKGSYAYKEPEIAFDNIYARAKFASLYNAAQESRKYINEYVPFSQMVY